MAPKVGLQLIVYGARPNDDLAGVMREAKEAGYAGIEAGNLFSMCGEGITRDAIAETGLAITGVHSGYGDAKDPAAIEAAIAYLKAVGSKYYIISGVAEGEGMVGSSVFGDTDFLKVGTLGIHILFHINGISSHI